MFISAQLAYNLAAIQRCYLSTTEADVINEHTATIE